MRVTCQHHWSWTRKPHHCVLYCKFKTQFYGREKRLTIKKEEKKQRRRKERMGTPILLLLSWLKKTKRLTKNIGKFIVWSCPFKVKFVCFLKARRKRKGRGNIWGPKRATFFVSKLIKKWVYFDRKNRKKVSHIPR